MKYNLPSEIIPKDARKEINDKILFLIETETAKENGITAQDIFSSFTGKGALHGLNFKDFENYYEYSERKKIEEEGQFFTPAKICKFIVDCVKPSETDLVADLCSGSGNFFNSCPVESNCYGTEIDHAAYKVARYLYPNANISNEDIRLYNPKVKLDIIFGNPPFNLRFKYEKDEYLSQLFYFIKAAEVMNPGGILAVIVPASFLADDFMDKKMIELVNERFNFILQANLPKNSFKDVGVNSFETKVMFFQKKSEHITEKKYNLESISVTISDNTATEIHKTYINPILEEKRKVHAKIILEVMSKGSEDKEFQFKVRKLLFDIKNSKHTKVKFAKAFDYVNQFYTQKCPDNMGWEEWEKIKITPNKVLSYLKRILKKQHIKSRDEIKLVKDRFGLRLKAYSNKSKLQLKQYPTVKVSINDMVLQENYPFASNTYRKLITRKISKFNESNKKWNELDPNRIQEIEKWLFHNPIKDYKENTSYTLTDIQRKDIAACILKTRGILSWEQGSGKSLGAISWYRYMRSQVKNTFILGPAIAINLTWDKILSDYREDYTLINSLDKITKIKPGQVVLISYDMLRKYEKQIKRFVKLANQKISLVVDESDEMTNHTSKRTQVVRSCFRKVKYMLLTTGTTTRNNINELYSQYELLYNNSINMLCECKYIYKFNLKEEQIEEKLNPYYMKPFPARFGNGLFKSCFNPFKQTVFGIKKHNQDLYNSDHLRDIIEKTIITRTFFDITGKKPKFEIIRVEQNKAEEYVYEVVINEFYKMAYNFRNTGNSRKESLLKIIRQIQLLIKATSIPQKFREYNSTQIPGKQKEILEMVGKFNKEKVAIGTIFKDAADMYAGKLKSLYPEREVFLIKGDVPFKQRKVIIAEFEKTKNGILISTQQSLKSSVNIPTCDKVIIEALFWNMPKIAQYYMRFVRFNSIVEKKKIIFVVYENSIEMNLLALLMDKQRLNEFIKTLDYSDRNSIFQEYGIDFNLIDVIMEKVTETVEGKSKVKIAWGKQKMS
jgi:trans-aconitate methyltransferase